MIGSLPRFSLTLGAALAFAGSASAQSTESDLLLRINGPVSVSAGQEAAMVVVIGDRAAIDGNLSEGLVVISGTAAISGQVSGSVVCVNGQVDLAATARITEDAVLIRCGLTTQPGAVVAGQTIHESGIGFGRRALIFLWLGVSMVLIAGAVVLAGLGGSLRDRGAAVLMATPGQAAAFGVVTWIAIPMIAAVTFATVVAAPLGFAILLVAGPLLWLLGYLTAAVALGLRLSNGAVDGRRPYLAAIVGAVLIQVTGLLPVIGGVVVLAAGVLGAGALVSLAWSDWRQRRSRLSSPVDHPDPAPAR